MLHRFRSHDAEGDTGGTYDWFEVGEDGLVVRQASFAGAVEPPRLPDLLAAGPGSLGEEFAGSAGGAVVAASRTELDWSRGQLGPLGVRLYEADLGTLVEGPVDAAEYGAEPVTEAEFTRAWRRARRDRTFTRVDTGPLPAGSRLTGTVTAWPWGFGVTGLFVDLGLPIHGFVDMGALLPPQGWPPVGTRTEFEVIAVRLDLDPDGGPPRGHPQVRLRVTGAPPPGRPWPSLAPR
ncbi:hypothetical protein [Streptomyces sp. NBC_01304]|uniref:hypothetical protein n=1 Tax=Streptomyces sp. NBC_01304 TaxID=2903818 RepID=UPI002E114C3F|nr:hypothetical protein OG430_10820 [Streptomyces sp. NBC_01304]